jgi:hypothetical protein
LLLVVVVVVGLMDHLDKAVEEVQGEFLQGSLLYLKEHKFG